MIASSPVPPIAFSMTAPCAIDARWSRSIAHASCDATSSRCSTGSRTPRASEGGVEFSTDLPSALAWALAHDFQECFIAGGEGLYREGLEHAECVYLTRVEAEPEGDTFFPELDPKRWHCVARELHASDERHAHAFAFVRWERRGPRA